MTAQRGVVPSCKVVALAPGRIAKEQAARRRAALAIRRGRLSAAASGYIGEFVLTEHNHRQGARSLCNAATEFGGPEALDDRSPRPDRVWNRIPDDVRSRVVTLALDEPELSPRELAVRFTDAERYFVSEASVYRLLKAHDLITSPAFITMKAADEFKNKTTAPNQLWQTDFTYLAGADSICQRSSTTSRATSSPGSSAPR